MLFLSASSKAVLVQSKIWSGVWVCWHKQLPQHPFPLQDDSLPHVRAETGIQSPPQREESEPEFTTASCGGCLSPS